MRLDARGDLTTLFCEVVDIESVSGNETRLADEVEQVLRTASHLVVRRFGDTIIARTDLGRTERVLIAGHLDTVPVAGNLPSQIKDGVVYGRGTADMKGGITVMIASAVELAAPSRDITWVFYDHEEVDKELNALGHLDPAELAADFAILMEPTSALIEGGCQGTLRFQVITKGKAAHSARPWFGHNAIHDVAEALNRLVQYQPKEVVVEGLTYRESLNAVGIEGGIAGNVIPDRCVLTINFRFAPDQDVEQAKEICRQTFVGFKLVFLDEAAGAKPGLNRTIAREFLTAVGGQPSAKFGWTDVARFAALGIPAVNFGPGNPGKAHADDEYCAVAELVACKNALTAYFG